MAAQDPFFRGARLLENDSGKCRRIVREHAKAFVRDGVAPKIPPGPFAVFRTMTLEQAHEVLALGVATGGPGRGIAAATDAWIRKNLLTDDPSPVRVEPPREKEDEYETTTDVGPMPTTIAEAATMIVELKKEAAQLAEKKASLIASLKNERLRLLEKATAEKKESNENLRREIARLKGDGAKV